MPRTYAEMLAEANAAVAETAAKIAADPQRPVCHLMTALMRLTPRAIASKLASPAMSKPKLNFNHRGHRERREMRLIRDFAAFCRKNFDGKEVCRQGAACLPNSNSGIRGRASKRT